MLSYHSDYPVSALCPNCGSGDYRTVDPDRTIAYVSDRVCRGCGTRYTPLTPRWAAILFCIVGAAGPFVLTVVAIQCARVFADREWMFRWKVYFLLAACGVFCIVSFAFGMSSLKNADPASVPERRPTDDQEAR